MARSIGTGKIHNAMPMAISTAAIAYWSRNLLPVRTEMP